MCVNVRKGSLATTVKTTLMTELVLTVRNTKFVLTYSTAIGEGFFRDHRSR